MTFGQFIDKIYKLSNKTDTVFFGLGVGEEKHKSSYKPFMYILFQYYNCRQKS